MKLEASSFNGKTEHSYDLGGLTVTETVYPPGLAIPTHEHINAFLCLLIDGRCEQSFAQGMWMSTPSTLTIFPAGIAHANHWSDSPARELHVEFSQSWLRRLPVRPTVLDQPANYEGGALVWLAWRLTEECRQQDRLSPLAMEGLALELLADGSRSQRAFPTSQPPAWLDRARELLRDRFSENLSLSDVAAGVEVSADYLVRAFRRHYGCTVGEFVRKLRVEFACRLLVASESPLTQIALDAGFVDQSHLTKMMKRHTGVTPAAFRNLHGGGRLRTMK